MVFIIYLSDGSGFCGCGMNADLNVTAWDVKANCDVLKKAKRCTSCYLAWQTAMLLKHQALKRKGTAA